MKESASVRFLYGTLPGRILLKVLTLPAVSRIGGALLSSRPSGFFVPWYIRKHNIDMKGVIIPGGGFRSFNAFFTRRRKSDVIPYAPLVSPCDAFLSRVPIGEDTTFAIKHTMYRLEQLLGSRSLAERFRGGEALIFRLTPAHYHRYAYATDGVIAGKKRLGGVLHCVRPIALERYPVFAQNAREYCVIRSDRLGPVVQMEIGALMVGKIENRQIRRGERVVMGREKGNFAFGGSTIVLLLTAEAVSSVCCRWDTKACEEQEVRILQVLADYKDEKP